MRRMAIFLDDEPIDLPGRTLGELLQAGARRLEPRGAMLVEVRLNGQVLQGAELTQRQDAPVAGAEVRLYSADPRALAAGALQGVRAVLQEAREVQQAAAALFQKDQQREAIERIGRMVQIWQQTQQAVLHSALLLKLPLDQIAVDGEPLPQMTEALIVQLKALRDGLAAADTVSLADALAYEWPAIADRWDRVAEELVRRIQA